MDLAETRIELEERREKLAAELAEITAVPRDPIAALSFGKRIGDGTNEAVERLNKIGVAEALEAKLADVQRSLEKLDEGTYGECDSCGERIPEERLEARPWTTFCMDCASR